MRYRIEMVQSELAIINVETGIKVGTAELNLRPHPYDPDNPNRGVIRGCFLKDNQGNDITPIGSKITPQIVICAAAGHQAHIGFRDLTGGVPCHDPQKIELRLGSLLTDGVGQICRAINEFSANGLTTQTEGTLKEILMQLYDIWCVSRFGSYNSEYAIDEPYFQSLKSLSHIPFSLAAREWGKLELHVRYPKVPDEMLDHLISLALEFLKDFIFESHTVH